MNRVRLNRSRPADPDLDVEADEQRVSPTNSPPVARFEKSSRSALTNGSVLVANADKRAPWVRRFRDVVHLLEDHLGGAGVISEVEKSLVKRAATLTVEAERLETCFANSDGVESVDLDLYLRTCGHLRRLLVDLGLEKRAGATPPSDASPYLYNTKKLMDAIAGEDD